MIGAKYLSINPKYFKQIYNNAWEQVLTIAGWSSLVARRAHNPKVVGSNPAPATNFNISLIIEVLEFSLKKT